ncbi:MAG: PAS domain-containing protein [Flavobacteriales bacterium]
MSTGSRVLELDQAQVLDQLPVGLVTIDSDLRYTYANMEAERFAGMPRNEFVGRVIYEVFPALRGGPLEEAFTHTMTTREVSRFTLPFAPHDTWYELVAHPAADGGIVVFFHDSKRRVLQEAEVAALREQRDSTRRLYETALANTPDFVYVWGRDHKFRYANQALLDLYGVTAEECIGHGFREVGYPEWHALMHEREIDEVVRTGKPLRGTIPFYGKGGGGIYDYIFVPVFGPDGEVEAVAGTTRDVTELDRANQALKDTDRRKDEFLATLAHELRNPLAPMRSGLDLLGMENDENTRQRTVAMMERQLGQMVHLVDDLLDLSRVSRGVIELRPEPTSVNAMVELALETSRPLIERYGHTLVLELPKDDPPLLGDRTRLAQVFSNLLNNAAKYTEPGGRIALKAERKSEEVIVSVTDSGIGIEQHELGRVFDMFTRLSRGGTDTRGGLGIGLHIVKRLVEMHGGRIEVASEGALRGSTFSVTLPITAAKDQVGPMRPTTGVAKSHRILIVDDNVDAAFTLSVMLKNKGHQVHATYGGQEALDIAGTFRPEFIFMDIGMPGLDGYEACKRLRAMPALRDTRIVALTGWGQEKDRQLAREAGFNDHLVKPVPLSVIEATLMHAGS